MSKCQAIVSHFSGSMCNSIFDYLKPDSNDRVTIFSFRLGMNIDGPIQADDNDYLPA